MAVSLTISLPDDVVRKIKEIAAREQMSFEEVVTAALSEQLAGVEYLRRRGSRASVERFRAALAVIPQGEPEPHDRLE